MPLGERVQEKDLGLLTVPSSEGRPACACRCSVGVSILCAAVPSSCELGLLQHVACPPNAAPGVQQL